MCTARVSLLAGSHAAPLLRRFCARWVRRRQRRNAAKALGIAASQGRVAQGARLQHAAQQRVLIPGARALPAAPFACACCFRVHALSVSCGRGAAVRARAPPSYACAVSGGCACRGHLCDAGGEPPVCRSRGSLGLACGERVLPHRRAARRAGVRAAERSYSAPCSAAAADAVCRQAGCGAAHRRAAGCQATSIRFRSGRQRCRRLGTVLRAVRPRRAGAPALARAPESGALACGLMRALQLRACGALPARCSRSPHCVRRRCAPRTTAATRSADLASAPASSAAMACAAPAGSWTALAFAVARSR